MAKNNADAANGSRTATVERKTAETQITARVNLDGTGACSCELGVPFFAHMINLFARHAMVDIDLSGKGDVEIDAHHTVEDAGITLGQAVRQALGDRSGIERYGEAFVPMEESLARCALDVCNRAYLKFDAEIPRTKVGEFDAELGEEFFRAFIMNAGITMHLALLESGNVHHMLEALFKAAGRAFGKAIYRNPRIRGVLSTKGTL